MKKSIPKIPLIYPLPLTILGVSNSGGTFYTTVSNLSVMGTTPPMISIMLDEKKHMQKQLEVGVRVSINIPSTTSIDKADLCATVSSDDFDKSILFDTQYALNTPYIEDFPVALIVEIIEHVHVKRHHLYICEVKKTLVEESLFVDQNIPSMNILDPIIYGLDEKYYQIGKVIGKAALEGKALYQNIRKTMPPKPYSFHFKYKLCLLKEAGHSYKDLSEEFDVYHETIEDWYALYTLFGREGLTKKMSNKLASTKFTDEEKNRMVQLIVSGKKTYRQVCDENLVSLSRLKNWVKKYRKESKK
ncbi:MAG: flavin reductase [Candidatus Izemoplasmataceae bacterium]|uniref:flavin reductase n=1 Tax=Liberiplasma polymorphum TaxID=3374570 RepID=UPI0037752A02